MVFLCRRTMLRIGEPICPEARAPTLLLGKAAAEKKGMIDRSIKMISAEALLEGFGRREPQKPPPTMTTRGMAPCILDCPLYRRERPVSRGIFRAQLAKPQQHFIPRVAAN